ncbi:MAG: NAD-dependent epimerase/dehydratase family protein [Thermodesulfobacteriota bacterium]|nr:NAD-dependent epimerase/dehydratase family protein [Thermodesulfobacteriota bacterium]
MKILVTGAAGFIGSNVVDGYVKAGHDVLGVDNLFTGKRSNVNPKARFYEMDVRSPEVAALIKRERPDVLNHHAAQISVPASVSDPFLDADINIRGLLNLLESSVRYGVGKFIFISSGGAIYGEAPEYPTSEACQPRPLSPYAVSKYSSEHYLAYYKHQYGLNFTTLRYANIYGPRQIPHGEAGVVAIFMDNILRGERSTLYHFQDDEVGMIRDYCYVADVVKANLSAVEKGGGDFFNIGTGLGTKTQALYELIYETFKQVRPGISQELDILNRQIARPGDVPRSCLTVEKARRLLGWYPDNDLRQGINKTLEWRLNRSL